MSRDRTEEENLKIWQYRTDMFRGIVREQFQLAYFGRVDYGSTEEMAIGERKILYELLIEQKQDEKKQHEQAMQEAKSGSDSGWRRKK